MISPPLLFLFLFLFSISVSLTTAQPLYQFCEPNYGNFTPNSTYHNNLNKALSSITLRSVDSHGYFSHSAGASNSSDRVNVVGLCRGDVNRADCYSCLNDSRRQIVDQCPTSKEAVAWYAGCMLRYSNRSISGELETDPSVVFYNLKNTTFDPYRFDFAVVSLLNFLTNRSAGGGSELKFASGNVSDAGSGTVYGLVQCLPHLSSKDCESCLSAGIDAYPKFFGGKIGGRILAPSCNYRFEVNIFYNLTAADKEFTLPADSYFAAAPAPEEMTTMSPAPAPALALPPVADPPPGRDNADTPTASVTNTRGEESKARRSVVIGSAYVAALMLLSIVVFL